MNASAPASAVAEIQGLYGPFSFSEKLLQKIWLRRDFAGTKAATLDGRRVTITHPGKWNLLGGPDFRGARLRIGDGPEITGDVELHLRASDWVAHAHARDRAYDGVVLHVVLFPPEPGHVTRGAAQEIPVLALLPLLHHDLEEFAADEAVESLAGRAATRIPEELSILPEAELTALLAKHATARWTQKVHFARLRIARLGWADACHHTALEILGYRFNRAPMLRVAGRWPLAEWGRESLDPGAIYSELRDLWSVQGVRPANHPGTRLRQYAEWVRAVPDWPVVLQAEGKRLGERAAPAAMGTRDFRRAWQMTPLRDHLAKALCAKSLTGERFDTLLCDGFVPLVAAQTTPAVAATLANSAAGAGTLYDLWYHWFSGDLPPFITRGLRDLEVFRGPARPACHGAAQGLLGWLLDREARPW